MIALPSKLSMDYRNLLAACFFVAFFLLGLSVFRDYGVSWDEPRNRENGLVAFNYVAQGAREIFGYFARDYGTAFELPLVMIERVFKVSDPYRIFQMRHFFTFLLFFVSVLIFYKLGREFFASRWLGLLGASFLVLSPRIFADSFYNSKDIALLSLFIISGCTFHRFFKKPSMISAALHAASSAYLADIRLVGLLMPIFTFVFIAGDFILIPEKRKEWKRQLAVLGAYAALFLFFLVLFWPLLWEDPAANFWNTLRGMGQFSRWSGTTLYLGEYVKAAE